MNNLRWGLALAFFCGFSGPRAGAHNLSKEWVEQAARPLVDQHLVDGLSIGFLEGQNYGIVHLGSASAAQVKATNLTLYELGSVSKVFTSLLLADAAVRGEINPYVAAEVENSAKLRLPSREERAIKWIDLATHRSGLPRLPGNLPVTDLIDPYREYGSPQATAFLTDYELPRVPGEAQEYSNFGASVLGYLLAERAGKSYDELLQERIAGPLAMPDCTVSLSAAQAERHAKPHSDFGSTTAMWTWADLPGAGGVHATMRDMMRFARAQLEPPKGELGEALELAWKQHTEADESGPAMGLGWMIAGDGQTRWHTGQTGGSTSALYLNRKLKCAVIVLCNTSVEEKIDQLAAQILLRAVDQEVKADPVEVSADGEQDQVAIDAALRHRLEGRYQLTPNFIFTVRDRNGRLMVGITNQPTQEVFPDSPTRWSYRGVDATLEFQLPNRGSARSLILHQDGNEQTARRIK